MRFLTKEDIKLSVEEFLFLYNVRFYTEETSQEAEELEGYIKLYYTQNKFYGRDLYPKEELKFNDWNLLINKLVKQNYLVDYRKDKSKLKINEFALTEEFNNKIFSNDKDAFWKEVEDMLVSKVGSRNIVIGNQKIGIFQLTNGFKSIEAIKSFLWDEICGGGNKYYMNEFLFLLEYYLDTRGLQFSFASYLNNYKNGDLKKDISEEMKMFK